MKIPNFLKPKTPPVENIENKKPPLSTESEPNKQEGGKEKVNKIEVNLNKREEIKALFEEVYSGYENQIREAMKRQEGSPSVAWNMIMKVFSHVAPDELKEKFKEMGVVLGRPNFKEVDGKNQFDGHDGSIVMEVNVTPSPIKDSGRSSYWNGKAYETRETDTIRGDYSVKIFDKKTGTELFRKTLKNIGFGIVIPKGNKEQEALYSSTFVHSINTESPDYQTKQGREYYGFRR
jgi:hypothetical protein